MGYEIVRYRPEFRPGVIDLLQHLVSPDRALNDAYFKWKHEDNPYSREPVVYLALAQGEVAGMRAFQGARWRLGSDDEIAAWPCACDFVVAPAHRGAKLFRQIMAFALADLAARGAGPLLNFSASPITYGASRRTGWQLVAPYTPWSRRTRRVRIVRALGDRLRRWPLAWRVADLPASLVLRAGFDALDAAWSRSGGAAPIVIAETARPDAMGALVRRTRTPLVQHERDAAYYRWRFGNPLSGYRFLYCGGPELEAFAVLQLSRRGAAADISIVDWASAQPEWLETMLSMLVAAGGYDSVSIWTTNLPPRISASLARCGFVASDDTRGDPGYRPGLLAIGPGGSDIRAGIPGDAAPFSSPQRWDLRMIYSDFY